MNGLNDRCFNSKLLINEIIIYFKLNRHYDNYTISSYKYFIIINYIIHLIILLLNISKNKFIGSI